MELGIGIAPMEVDGLARCAGADLPAGISSSTALSELALLNSIFGFPDLPAGQEQSNTHYYTRKFCAFVEALEQQVCIWWLHGIELIQQPFVLPVMQLPVDLYCLHCSWMCTACRQVASNHRVESTAVLQLAYMRCLYDICAACKTTFKSSLAHCSSQLLHTTAHHTICQ